MNKINNIDEANKFLAGYIKRFNKKFSVPPSNEKSDFMPLPKHIILDRLLTVKYTRTLDNGGCFSLNNVIFMVNNCKFNPKTKVTVLISRLSSKSPLIENRFFMQEKVQKKPKPLV
jgi:hypothetical protein